MEVEDDYSEKSEKTSWKTSMEVYFLILGIKKQSLMDVFLGVNDYLLRFSMKYVDP